MGTNDTPHTLQEKQFVGLRILKYSVIRAIYLNNVTLIVDFATMDRRDLQCGPQDPTKKPGYLAGWSSSSKDFLFSCCFTVSPL